MYRLLQYNPEGFSSGATSPTAAAGVLQPSGTERDVIVKLNTPAGSTSQFVLQAIARLVNFTGGATWKASVCDPGFSSWAASQ